MADATFLGLPQTTWRFINTFAPWFSAAGTVSAVAVSLSLARAQRRAWLRLLVGHRIMVERGGCEPFPEFVVIRVVNLGARPIRVTNLGWRVGMFKPRFAIQTVSDPPFSSKLPVEVEHGQEATWFVPMDFEEGWAERFAQKMLMPNWRRALETLRFEVYTSVGHVSRTAPEPELRALLAKTCRRLEQHVGG